ncbi:MAG: hypothetical protein ABJB74_03265 [Gemmatimonas sp.]
MRAPLTPLKAFIHDAANLGKGHSSGSNDDPRLSLWLTVAQAAERLAASHPDLRDEYADHLRRSILPERRERPSQIEGDGRAPTDRVSQLAERLRVEAEDMELAGCFELARTTVSSVCQMLARAPLTNRLLATAHLGRVNRQLGDLNSAVDCYSTVTEEGQAANDGPVAAHGFIGLGNVAHARGNRPAQKSLFEQALGLAARGSTVELSAHQGLMIVANAQNLLADALLHGWRAHDLAPPDSELQLAIVGNLAHTAFRAGFYVAALAGNQHVIQKSRVAFHRLPSIGTAIRSAAHLGFRDEVCSLQAVGDEEIGHGAPPFEVARLYLWYAEAWSVLGEGNTVTELLAKSVKIADSYGFHELRIRAETFQLQRTSVPNKSVRPLTQSFDPNSSAIVDGIGRLESLAAV